MSRLRCGRVARRAPRRRRACGRAPWSAHARGRRERVASPRRAEGAVRGADERERAGHARLVRGRRRGLSRWARRRRRAGGGDGSARWRRATNAPAATAPPAFGSARGCCSGLGAGAGERRGGLRRRDHSATLQQAKRARSSARECARDHRQWAGEGVSVLGEKSSPLQRRGSVGRRPRRRADGEWRDDTFVSKRRGGTADSARRGTRAVSQSDKMKKLRLSRPHHRRLLTPSTSSLLRAATSSAAGPRAHARPRRIRRPHETSATERRHRPSRSRRELRFYLLDAPYAAAGSPPVSLSGHSERHPTLQRRAHRLRHTHRLVPRARHPLGGGAAQRRRRPGRRERGPRDEGGFYEHISRFGDWDNARRSARNAVYRVRLARRRVDERRGRELWRRPVGRRSDARALLRDGDAATT